eukprot:Gb_36545 [translate_table: standard]
MISPTITWFSSIRIIMSNTDSRSSCAATWAAPIGAIEGETGPTADCAAVSVLPF